MEIGKCHGVRHVVTAQNVTDGEVQFNAEFSSPLGAIVVVRTAAGALKAWDGIVTPEAGKVTIDNSGGVDWAATDTIDVIWF